MPRAILLFAGLTVFSAVFVQGQTAYPYSTTAPANGPFGGPILVTPSAGFPNPAPTAGISDAGRAGISIENNAGTIISNSGEETTIVRPNSKTLVDAPAI